MIVFDVSALVSAVLKAGSVPAQALIEARAVDQLAISAEIEAELRRVLMRHKFDRYVSRADREDFIGFVLAAAHRVQPTERVAACRDPNDDMYLEAAIAADAHTIVSSDADLLVLNPWRDIRIVGPGDYLRST